MPQPLRIVLAILFITPFAQAGEAQPTAAAPPSAALVVKSFPIRDTQAKLEPEQLDRRFAPQRWQACIGLPDDPYKSVIGSDGGLYYDYGKSGSQRYENGEGRFGTCLRVTLNSPEKPAAAQQSLLDPRTPLVITEQSFGKLRLRQEAWAGSKFGGDLAERSANRVDYLRVTVANDGDGPAQGELTLNAGAITTLCLNGERTSLRRKTATGPLFCQFSKACEPLPETAATAEKKLGKLAVTAETPIEMQHDWAHPKEGVLPCFRNVMIGWNQPIRLAVPVKDAAKYRIAIGLIEGYHAEPGKRPLELRVEGAQFQFVDPVKQVGKDVPLVVTSTARDSNGDGKITVEVLSAEKAEDQNTILSALWVFPEAVSLDEKAILAGKGLDQALAVVDVDHQVDSPRELKLTWKFKLEKRGDVAEWSFAVPQSTSVPPPDVSAPGVQDARDRAIAFWKNAGLPYDRIRVPDPAVQAQLDSCIRNIYQAREIRDGRPAFQVGPTCYRGTWAADGPFILEAVTYLGRADEVRAGLEQQVDGDSGPGGVGFSKKCGLRLWMIRRHYELTGDREWLKHMWSRVVRDVNQIAEYRKMTRDDPNQANFGLMPRGFGDGGLGGEHREYTNVYWTLAGLKAAIAMAQDQQSPEVEAWRAEYNDYWSAFERARERDKLADASGNVYVPVTMRGEQPQLPQRGAWAFLQSVFPGRIFDDNDKLMLGTMAMLDATEREGLIFGTGWIEDGIWNYAASFYAHAHLWIGHGRKAAATLYAMGNHACPLLCWREEQSPLGEPQKYVGDMPHNWASAEFIRLARHLLVLERGSELHLLEGLPRAWTKPGCVTELHEVPTTFGPVTMSLKIADDGKSATLQLVPPARNPAATVVVHLESLTREGAAVRINGQPGADAQLDLSSAKPVEIQVALP